MLQKLVKGAVVNHILTLISDVQNFSQTVVCQTINSIFSCPRSFETANNSKGVFFKGDDLILEGVSGKK